jgi:arylsulfatase A-like enzyme
MKAFLAFCFLLSASFVHAADKPNFVFILCDDLGYGDVRCLNPDGKIATPNMDRIAREGVLFSDAHTPSSVCTPTRYGVMTGRYNWRTKLQSGVLGGLSPRLIEQGRMTVADLLKSQGYGTACIGKWHLGMDWTVKPGQTVAELSIEAPEQAWSADFTQPAKNGPLSVGFDHYFGISASLDMVPYVFIEDDHVVAQPTETMKLKMNIEKQERFTREGPGAPGFKGEDVLPTLGRRAAEYIARSKDKPFFLYLPLNSPHTPILPTDEWRGKAHLNAYADFVMQTDAVVGQVLEALETAGVAQNTFIVLTSDNGCSPSADYPALLEKGHNPSHVFRGHKADIYEGGHRVPFFVRWPAQVAAGQISGQIVCLTDFMATVAEITGATLPENAGEDSISFLPVLLGQKDKPLRQQIVHHSITGNFAIREGKWKLALCPGSGGWSDPRPGSVLPAGAPQVQLFDLEADIGERTNLQQKFPEIVANLTMKLETLVAHGRSTPGDRQSNAVAVDIWKKNLAEPKAKKKAAQAKASKGAAQK